MSKYDILWEVDEMAYYIGRIIWKNADFSRNSAYVFWSVLEKTAPKPQKIIFLYLKYG